MEPTYGERKMHIYEQKIIIVFIFYNSIVRRNVDLNPRMFLLEISRGAR